MADSEETQRGFLFAVARMYFSAFLALAFAHIKGGAILKANWHHDALAYELDLIAKGKSKRLVIAMPPRNLKSTIVTVAWVTFMLGVDPTLNFVCLSYSDDLATDFAGGTSSSFRTRGCVAAPPATSRPRPAADV